MQRATKGKRELSADERSMMRQISAHNIRRNQCRHIVERDQAEQVSGNIEKRQRNRLGRSDPLPSQHGCDGGGINGNQSGKIYLGLSRGDRLQSRIQCRFGIVEGKRCAGLKHVHLLCSYSGLASFSDTAGKLLVFIRQRLDQAVDATLADFCSEAAFICFYQPGTQNIDVVDFPAIR